jgi:hypothetical protein
MLTLSQYSIILDIVTGQSMDSQDGPVSIFPCDFCKLTGRLHGFLRLKLFEFRIASNYAPSHEDETPMQQETIRLSRENTWRDSCGHSKFFIPVIVTKTRFTFAFSIV